MSNSNLSIVPTSPEGHGSDGRSPSQQSSRRPAAPAPEAEATPPANPGQRLMIEEAEGGVVRLETHLGDPFPGGPDHHRA